MCVRYMLDLFQIFFNVFAPAEHNLCRKECCIHRRVSTLLF